MSVFLTPELKPFLGGTYFPPKDSYRGLGFSSLLEKVSSRVRMSESAYEIRIFDVVLRMCMCIHTLQVKIKSP